MNQEFVVLDNLYTQATGLSSLIKECLTYKPKGYIFSPAYKSGAWDGRISLLKQSDDLGYYFPTGLLRYVLDHCALHGLKPPVRDLRQKPSSSVIMFSNRPGVTLEPHQDEAVYAMLAAERGVAYYPTGTGKSIVIAELIRRLRVPTLVLAPTKVVMKQMHAAVERGTGAPAGMLGDGHWKPGVVTVATFQAITSRLKGRKDRHPKENRELKDEVSSLLAGFQLVIADEGHHLEAATFEQIMKKLPNAYYRYAFSATPFKSGGSADLETFLRVAAWTGPVASFLSITEAVETGRIVPPDIHIIHLPPEEKAPALNYQEEIDNFIVHNPLRNLAITDLAKTVRRAGPTCIIVDRTTHGTNLARTIGCPFIHGGTTATDREAAFSQFRKNRLSCLIVSKVGDEGLDLPNIQFLILAAGGKAAHRQIQRIGRGMRASEGKSSVQVFDFADALGKHLPAHYRSRRRAYERERAYTVSDMAYSELQELLK